jgi:hypothetical protein
VDGGYDNLDRPWNRFCFSAREGKPRFPTKSQSTGLELLLSFWILISFCVRYQSRRETSALSCFGVCCTFSIRLVVLDAEPAQPNFLSDQVTGVVVRDGLEPWIDLRGPGLRCRDIAICASLASVGLEQRWAKNFRRQTYID